MTTLEIITSLLCITAVFAYINQRFLRLQTTIGLMLLALILAGLAEALHHFEFSAFHYYLNDLLNDISFSEFVLQGVLCFLLFASSLKVSSTILMKEKWQVATLSLIATLLTAILVGVLCWLTFRLLGTDIPLIVALIFGAIVSPTDPIAALAVLNSIGLPKKLETLIDGESEFNDGIGVVLFVTLTSIVFGSHSPSLSETIGLFAREVIGGVVLGAVIAILLHVLIRGVLDKGSQVVMTLAAVCLNYAIAEKFGISGPIASVILGLIFGNYTLHKAVDISSHEALGLFWDMLNTTLIAVLFVLIGLEVIIIQIPKTPLVIMPLLAIAFVLASRYFSVMISGYLLDLPQKYKLTSHIQLTNLLTWAGLRGGLAIALVMSLPPSKLRDLYLLMTYAVVVFSILIQGSTIKYLFSPQSLKDMVKEKNS